MCSLCLALRAHHIAGCPRDKNAAATTPMLLNAHAQSANRRGVDARADLPAAGPLPGGASTAAAVLLELAMDEKLLGRTFWGWRPFV